VRTARPPSVGGLVIFQAEPLLSIDGRQAGRVDRLGQFF
jgi:hypothetical protein